MAENVIRLLAVDSFGTIFDVQKGLTAAIEAEGLPDAAALAKQWVKTMQTQTAQIQSPEEFRPFPEVVAGVLDQLAHEQQLSISPPVRKKLLDAWHHLPVYPDAQEGLQQWQDLGAMAWMVTNGDPDGIQDLLEETGLQDLVQGVMTAEAVERYKPAKELYLRAATAAGVSPSQIVMASALANDVKGASDAGCRTARIQRESPEPGEGCPTPDWSVPGFLELIPLLQALLPRRDTREQVF